MAGTAALVALPLAPGAVRDVLFQVAFGAYVAGFMNLNPFLDRDGYHMLVDLLREPQLRRRSRARLAGAIAGEQGAPERRLVTRVRVQLAGVAAHRRGADSSACLALH